MRGHASRLPTGGLTAAFLSVAWVQHDHRCHTGIPVAISSSLVHLLLLSTMACMIVATGDHGHH